jgi:hypothetical protein
MTEHGHDLGGDGQQFQAGDQLDLSVESAEPVDPKANYSEWQRALDTRLDAMDEAVLEAERALARAGERADDVEGHPSQHQNAMAEYSHAVEHLRGLKEARIRFVEGLSKYPDHYAAATEVRQNRQNLLRPPKPDMSADMDRAA